MLGRRRTLEVILGVLSAHVMRAQAPSGPYCWSGKDSRGSDTYLPCEEIGLSTGTLKRSIELDLSGIAEIRINFGGTMRSLPVSEILTSMDSADVPEPRAKR